MVLENGVAPFKMGTPFSSLKMEQLCLKMEQV